jgi:hypothetical protein
MKLERCAPNLDIGNPSALQSLMTCWLDSFASGLAVISPMRALLDQPVAAALLDHADALGAHPETVLGRLREHGFVVHEHKDAAVVMEKKEEMGVPRVLSSCHTGIVDGYVVEGHVPADAIRQAARILGTGKRLVSTVLQGVYQSHQATAAAVQVNNIHLVRGMIGRPGCTVFQMNGQPTAHNTRECGADGDLPGFRNWDNYHHKVALLADRYFKGEKDLIY